jgi:hypothetical protein
MREGSMFTTATRLAEHNAKLNKKMEEMSATPIEAMGHPPDGENLSLANGMLLHDDHNSPMSKRSSLTAPTVLKYPRGG